MGVDHRSRRCCGGLCIHVDAAVWWFQTRIGIRTVTVREVDDGTNPTAREVVELATHHIESSHRPTVDVFLNGSAIATINIDLTCTIAGLIAGIRQGRLMEVQSGTCGSNDRLPTPKPAVRDGLPITSIP